MDRHIKILLAGEGGQGIQTIAKLLTQSAFEQGLETIYIPNFGVEQRGGVSIAFVQIGDKPITAPKFKTADYAVITSDRAYERVFKNLDSKTVVVFDPDTVQASAEKIRKSVDNFYEVPAMKSAKKELIPRSANIILLGAISGILKMLSTEIIVKLMHKKFEKHYKENPDLKKLNEDAFKIGLSAIGERS